MIDVHDRVIVRVDLSQKDSGMIKIHNMSCTLIKKLLEAIGKDFLQSWENGNIVEDYKTDYFPIYQELLSDLFVNYCELQKTHRFTENMPYGGCIKYLLQIELQSRPQ